MTTPTGAVTASRAGSRTLFRSLAIVSAVICPALVFRVVGIDLDPVVGLIAYGGAVVGASFVLAWAAEAAQVDVSGSLAVAVLAVIAVLPEYAVDLYYAYTAGHLPEYTQYAAANMTGSNRLLMGLGWPVVVLVSVLVARRTSGRKLDGLELEPSNRVEIGFLLIAGVAVFAIPATGRIHIGFGLALLGWFGYYLFKLTRGDVEEPELIGTAAALGELARTQRAALSCAPLLFLLAAAVIVTCAKPFADNLIGAGTQVGHRSLPAGAVACAAWRLRRRSSSSRPSSPLRGKGGNVAIAMLISAKVNQWTLLIGSLPVAYMLGGGSAAMHLDGRQIEEIVLTAAQTLMGVTLLLGLRFQRWAAWALLGLFVVQFPLTSTDGRLALSGVYGVIALGGR